MKHLVLKRQNIICLSPHMDDAVFSCLDHLLLWKGNNQITIVSIFTRFDTPFLTPAAAMYMQYSGCNNIEELNKRRLEEDTRAMKMANIAYRRLNFIDAAFRQNNQIPLYPKYKNIFSGKINEADKQTVKKIKHELASFCKADLVLVPQGIGSHIDHLITRMVAQQVFPKEKIMYYFDYPYTLFHPLKKWKIILTKKVNQLSMSSTKREIMMSYDSQINQLFSRPIDYNEILYT